MKTFGIALVIAVTAILFPSCKYEDGPLISLRSKDNRIRGWKRIAEYHVDSVDSLPYVLAAFDSTSYDSTGFLWFTDVSGNGITCHRGCIGGYWNFQESKSKIRLRMPSPIFKGEVFPIGNWELIRLSYEELWLSISHSGKDYLLKFERLD